MAKVMLFKMQHQCHFLMVLLIYYIAAMKMYLNFE